MGRFFLGFAVGAAVGALLVLLAGRSDDAPDAMTLAPGSGGGLKSRLAGALQAGREAAGATERTMMAEFKSRVKKPA